MKTKLALSLALVSSAALALAACVSWTPSHPISPGGSVGAPAPTATCDPADNTPGWIFVVFSDAVPGERAAEIIAETGASIVPIMAPLLGPPDGYLEVVGVPSPDQEAEYIALFEAYSEVVRALPDWPECPPAA
jgi:hypothetical protein